MTINNKIANLSLFAALMVVGIHTAGREPNMIERGSALWWFEAIVIIYISILL